MTAATEAEKVQQKAEFIKRLRKFPDFEALIIAAEAGAIGSSGSIISSMTSDFIDDGDENSREAKASAEMLRLMAQFFAVKHDDVLNEHGGSEDIDAEAAFIDMDGMRSDLVDKLWMYHDAVTTRWFPGNSEKKARGRRAAGNHVNNILDKCLRARQAILSKQNDGDPLFAVAPPTKNDFSKSLQQISEQDNAEKDGEAETDDTEANRRREGGRKAAEWLDVQGVQQHGQPDGHHDDNVNGDVHDANNDDAIATEIENERLQEFLRKQEEKTQKVKEELKNLEAIQT